MAVFHASTTCRGRSRGRTCAAPQRIVLGLLLAIGLCPAWAAAQPEGSGLPVLRQAPLASMLSASEAHGAVSNGAASAYSNPAAGAFADDAAVQLGYTFWISGITTQYAGVLLKRENHSFGFGLYNSGTDDLQARDRPGPSDGRFSAGTLSLSGLYAYRWRNLAVGGALHVLREEVFQYRASGYSLSAGIAGRFASGRVSSGLSLEHAGRMEALDLSRTDVPTQLRMATAVRLATLSIAGSGDPSDLTLDVGLLADLVQPLGDDARSVLRHGLAAAPSYSSESMHRTPMLHLAGTFELNELLRFTLGTTFGETARPFSTGLGLRLDTLEFHYAMIPFETGYGTAHSLGLKVPLP